MMIESIDNPDMPSPSIDEVLESESSDDKAVVGGKPDEARDAATSAAGDTGRQALDVDGANTIAARCRPTVLVLAGSTNSGKTSTYAAIYERLGRGPFAGWTFAGSKTIPAFEQRCHWWRIESKGSDLFMAHTQAEDLPWLHIQLQDEDRRQSARDLLLGDFDGEFFDDVVKGKLSASDLPFLRRADHVGVVVDGEKIADMTTRASERAQFEYLLAELLKGDAIADPAALMIVVTKFDLIESISEGQEAKEIEDFLAGLNADADKLAGRNVPLVRLAVRSRSADFPLGHGLETLLELLSINPKLQIEEEDIAEAPATVLSGFRA